MTYTIEELRGSYVSVDVSDTRLNAQRIKELIDNNIRFDYVTAKTIETDDLNGLRVLI